jgi:hypothetical protein
MWCPGYKKSRAYSEVETLAAADPKAVRHFKSYMLNKVVRVNNQRYQLWRTPGDNDNVPTYRRLSNIRNPSSCWAICDLDRTAPGANASYNFPVNDVSVHGGTRVYGYMDGRATRLSISKDPSL